MFEAGGGVPVQDQFHQFIASSNSSAASASAVASRTPTSISVALPLPNFLHPHASSSFDPYTFASSTAAASSTSAQQVQQFLHQLHQLPHPPPPPQLTTTKIINQGKVQETNNSNMVGMNLEINERDQTSADSWSNDEVLALLRIRSSIENWFPDFTWEHVSRKLAEVGFKLRSGEKCKEKFEEESRYFNNNIHYTNNNKISNYCTVFSEFEDLYHHGDHHHHHQTHPNHDHDHDQVGLAADQENKKILESDKPISDDHDQEEDKMRQNLQEDQEEDNINPRIDHQTVVSSDHDQMRSRSTKNNKRKRRHRKFEMLKGFCEGVVKRLMDQQEEMHNKILEDMVRRDEEKFAREERWKKQEMDRMNQEIEVRAQEQVVAGDGQAKIIKFLKELTSSSVPVQNLEVNKKVSQNPNPQIESSSSSLLPPHENPSSDNAPISLNNPKIQSLSPPPPPPRNPSKSLPPQNLRTKSITATASNEKLDNDIGKRWPRDEVLALINLRSSTVYNNNDSNNNDHQEMKEGGGNNSNKDQKGPLWERISQGMAELGYKRSAKRCKEKWENINKYFRKTKDINKKRSVDSRTCPYFHQLSNLYNNQASSVVIAPSDDDLTGPAENRSVAPEANGSSSTLHGLEGDKNVVQEAGFDYEL